MADPNVKNVAAAQVNKSLAANYRYIKKSSEKTINNSFGNLILKPEFRFFHSTSIVL